MNKQPAGAPVGRRTPKANMASERLPRLRSTCLSETSGEIRTKYNNFKIRLIRSFASSHRRTQPATHRRRRSRSEREVAGLARARHRAPERRENRGRARPKSSSARTRGVESGISDASDLTGPTNQGDFHTYGFDWEPHVVKFLTSIAPTIRRREARVRQGQLPIPTRRPDQCMNFWCFRERHRRRRSGQQPTYPMIMQVRLRALLQVGYRFYPVRRRRPACRTPTQKKISTTARQLDRRASTDAAGL